MLMPEAEWDAVNEVEVREILGADAVDHSAVTDIEYLVKPSSGAMLPIRCLYSASTADTLVVSFHGSLQRTRYQLPRFEWRATLKRLDAGTLMIADTTLDLDDAMPLGWYVGTESADLVKTLVEFIGQFAVSGGYSRIALVGSSGGGYAALAVSRHLPGSLAVGFSPQTRIADYVPWVQRRFVTAAFPDLGSIDAVEEKFADRVNLRSLYTAISEPANYVRYVQNSNDRNHVERHFRPFAEAMQINPELGGSDPSGRINLILEPMAKGHQPPSRGRFIGHIKEAHEVAFGVSLEGSQPSEGDLDTEGRDNSNNRGSDRPIKIASRFKRHLPGVPFGK